MSVIHLPPDPTLVGLAALVNQKLSDDTRISFFFIVHGDKPKETGIIYQCGTRRSIVTTRELLTEHSADDLIEAMRQWCNTIRASSKWTENPRELS